MTHFWTTFWPKMGHFWTPQNAKFDVLTPKCQLLGVPRTSGHPKWPILGHFLDPFGPLFMFHPNMHAIVGQYEGASTDLQKRVQKVVLGVSRTSRDHPKLDILSTKCQIWHVRFAKNWPIFGQKMGPKMGPFLAHFWAISRTTKYDPSTWKGVKNDKKRVQKMAHFWTPSWPKRGSIFGPKKGPKMAKKWVSFWTIFGKTRKFQISKVCVFEQFFSVDFWPKTTGSYLCKVLQNHQIWHKKSDKKWQNRT